MFKVFMFMCRIGRAEAVKRGVGLGCFFVLH